MRLSEREEMTTPADYSATSDTVVEGVMVLTKVTLNDRFYSDRSDKFSGC